MNKKLFLGMFAAAGMLLATSCSNDELDAVQSGNEAQVTFNLGTEGSIATRAISDGTGAKKLVYAVYKLDANGNPVLQNVVGSDTNGQFVDNEAFDNGLTETVSVTLAKGQTYQVAFWAQNPSCTAYTTTDLTNVGVSYDDATNNDETRDAFFKTVEFTVNGSTSIDVELKRPFAQINVGVTAEDWEAAVASGITIEKSSVVIKNAATSLNLLDGTVGEETVEVSYALNAIPSDPTILEVDADGDGTKEKYNWLSMSYILPAAEQTGYEKATLDNVAFVFAPTSGENIEFNQGLNSVPVQRNWRTNILGKILTGDITFNIVIDPVYEDDHNVNVPYATINGVAYASFAEAMAAVQSGETIKLEGETTLEGIADSKLFTVNKNITIDLNGYGFVAKMPDVTKNSSIFEVVNGGELTITGEGDVKVVTAKADNCLAAFINNIGGTVNLNGGNWTMTAYDNWQDALIPTFVDNNSNTANVTLNINGGTYTFNRNLFRNFANGKSTVATMNINGGTFNGRESDAGAIWNQKPYAAAPDGAGVINVMGGTFNNVVIDDEFNGLTLLSSENLAEVANGGIFVLTDDITVTNTNNLHTQAATANITINGNGNSIVSSASSIDDFQWSEDQTISYMSTILSSAQGSNAKVTVNNLSFEGTMTALSLGHYVNSSSNWYTTELNNVNVVNTKVVSFSAGISPAVCVYGTATLNNCNIYGTTLSELDTDPKWPVYDLAAVNYTNVTINGGKIGSIYMWNQAEVTINENTEVETIVIRGNMNASKYGLKINAGATVGTIDLSAITNKARVNITIESGATVSSIVANGNTYESIEAFKNAQ